MTETAVWFSYVVVYGFTIGYLVSLVRRDRVQRDRAGDR